jgi:hypothetical protein
MRAFIGYALVVVGIPHAVGLLAGLPLVGRVQRFASPDRMYRTFAMLDLVNGAGCLAAAILLFWLLGLEMTLVLPVVLGIRSVVYFFPKEQFLMGVCHVVGIFAAWMAFRYFFCHTIQ